MSLKVACIGGGPGGLFAATLIKRQLPTAEVTVFERNRADATYGFGVVFSDATLAKINAADPVLIDGLREHGTHWDHIEVRVKGERIRTGGNGMAAIARQRLLTLLQQNAADAGVDVRYSSPAAIDDLRATHDLVIASDGANSLTRQRYEEHFAPSAEQASAKFIWFGTTHLFDSLTFIHSDGPHGVFAVHAYPISTDVSTFIVETDEASWRAAGLDEFDDSQPPGPSDEKSRAYLAALFADEIDGAPLLVNNSRWANFRTRRAAAWSHENIAILGDAAHTAHFSVGAGTKMAMEDAIELARAVAASPGDMRAALVDYEAAARPSVDHIQSSARPSLSWWEHFGRYYRAFEPTTFAFHFMTRSIGRERLARRDPAFVERADVAWLDRHGEPPLDTPIDLAPGIAFASRSARVEEVDGQPWLVDGSDPDQRLALHASAPDAPGPWALWLAAPEHEQELTPRIDAAAPQLDAAPSVVVVHSGASLTRVLLAEELRLERGITVGVVEAANDDDRARTLVLSGRSDLVAAGTSSDV